MTYLAKDMTQDLCVCALFIFIFKYTEGTETFTVVVTSSWVARDFCSDYIWQVWWLHIKFPLSCVGYGLKLKLLTVWVSTSNV